MLDYMTAVKQESVGRMSQFFHLLLVFFRTDALANFGSALVKTVMLLCVRRETKVSNNQRSCLGLGRLFKINILKK